MIKRFYLDKFSLQSQAIVQSIVCLMFTYHWLSNQQYILIMVAVVVAILATLAFSIRMRD